MNIELVDQGEVFYAEIGEHLTSMRLSRLESRFDCNQSDSIEEEKLQFL